MYGLLFNSQFLLRSILPMKHAAHVPAAFVRVKEIADEVVCEPIRARICKLRHSCKLTPSVFCHGLEAAKYLLIHFLLRAPLRCARAYGVRKNLFSSLRPTKSALIRVSWTENHPISLVLGRSPMIGNLLVIEMPDASDQWVVTVSLRPIDRFMLSPKSAKHVICMVFDNVIVNG